MTVVGAMERLTLQYGAPGDDETSIVVGVVAVSIVLVGCIGRVLDCRAIVQSVAISRFSMLCP